MTEEIQSTICATKEIILIHRPFSKSLLLLALGSISGAALAVCSPTSANRPVCPAAAAAATASFIDPTASITGTLTRVTIKEQTYIGPFAAVTASGNVAIGHATNLQDNVVVGGKGAVTLGDEVILAHGAQVMAPATIGRTAVAGEHNASFVGFNSLVEGAKIEHDAMVLHLARVAPGVTVKHGMVVLSGKNVTTQAQADNVALGKVTPITDGLRAFMEGVLHVNKAFAREYTNLYRDNSTHVRGINYDPGNSDFNPLRNLPTLDGVATRAPGFRNRIIGDVTMADSLSVLSAVMGDFISLRADEGEPFHVGSIGKMGDRTTFHALEHTGLDIHDHVSYGNRSIVHGGSGPATSANPHAATVVGDDVSIGNYAVVFRSVLGNSVKVGCGSLVQDAVLPAGTVIPKLTIVEGANSRPVEWNPGRC
jgi:carbonic anhydrase/acetyltransferase-like protein (isoleucine patch superfamily)